MSSITANQKEQARETRQSLIEKVKSYWPDLIITEGNLQKPTQSFVYKFYSEFYSEYEKNLFNIETNLLKQEPEQLIDVNAYAEEIYLGIKLRKISKQLNETMPFYLNDIYEPQPRRTVLFFSVFMNLLIYMKTDNVYVDEICEVAEKAENYRLLYKQKQALLGEINNMNLLHCKLEDNIQKLTTDIEIICSEYKDILMQKEEKEYEYQNDIKLRNKLKQDIESFDKYLVRLRGESAELNEQFVEEPEIEEMRNKICTLEKEMENLDIGHSAIFQSLEEQRINAESNKRLELLCAEFKCNTLDYLKTSLESVSDANQEISKYKEQINNTVNEGNELKIKLKVLNEKILIARENVSDLKIKMENSIKELIQIFTLLSEKNHNDQNESINYKNDIEELKNEISIVEQATSLLKASGMKEYDQLIQYQANIYNSFNNALINIDNYQSRNI